jgi:hypothetical protein
MAEKMGWTNLANPFEYNFDRGLYFHYVAPDLVVGSQPRHAADVDDLAKEGVTHILNLQQDKDLEYWNVSLHEISSRSAHHGMHLIRTPAVDFSPHSLRDTLPRGELACWPSCLPDSPSVACIPWPKVLVFVQTLLHLLLTAPLPLACVLQLCVSRSWHARQAARSTCTALQAWGAALQWPSPPCTGLQTCSWMRRMHT